MNNVLQALLLVVLLSFADFCIAMNINTDKYIEESSKIITETINSERSYMEKISRLKTDETFFEKSQKLLEGLSDNLQKINYKQYDYELIETSLNALFQHSDEIYKKFPPKCFELFLNGINELLVSANSCILRIKHTDPHICEYMRFLSDMFDDTDRDYSSVFHQRKEKIRALMKEEKPMNQWSPVEKLFFEISLRGKEI